MKRFMALYDVHWGYDRIGGHKAPVHDPAAIGAMLDFAKDFKPHHIILGGDIIDCRMVSHHTKGKPGEVEGLKLLADAKECRKQLLDPLEAAALPGKRIYITGNHEDWLNDVVAETPGLEGILDLDKLFDLSKDWQVIPCGGHFNLGKLTFIHGDQISSGEHSAKAAVTSYERSVRLGHTHTYQVYTKNSPLDSKHPKTGIVVPCLCKKNHAYSKNAPNKWVQGFLYGWADEKTFSDYVAVIIDGQVTIGGKTYGR